MVIDPENLQDNDNSHYNFARQLAHFAKTANIPLKDLTKNTNSASTTFTKYTKEDILKYLEAPARNEKNLRNASIYMTGVSTQYSRLINYFAKMPTWAYVVSLATADVSKYKPENIAKQYYKVVQTLENMNIKHEFVKIGQVAFREDTFFGVVWETSDSFYIQKINPDYCELSSIDDGVYNFCIDMSKIKEDELYMYPSEVTKMYNDYIATGQRKQEVPSSISACFKVNEDLLYNMPPFVGVLPALYDLEDYKSLQKQRTEIGNYKALSMTIPVDSKDGTPLFDWDIAMQYYQQMTDVLPDYVGGIISPMKIDSWDFQKSGGLSDTDEVHNSEELVWSTAGTSSLLFGGGDRTSSSSLELSIRCDEEIVFGFLAQCERWINRRLKLLSGTIKFKVNLLPVTVYNKKSMIQQYTEGGAYGMPSKSAMFASMGFTPTEQIGLNYLETNVLEIQNYIPLSSSYTQSASDTGRPTNESLGETLSDSGELTKESK